MPSNMLELRNLRILVVDDYVDATHTLRRLLEIFGHEVHVCFTGSEALEHAPRLRPHAILLDIGLPDINGNEVAMRLRRDPNMHQTAIVALTGYAGAASEQLALQSGFDFFLAKPAESAQLQELIRQITTQFLPGRNGQAAGEP